MADIFKIDGVAYDVGVESVKRTAEIREGSNGGETLSGYVFRDIKGTYYHYTVVLSVVDMPVVDYDALYQVLTAPETSHEVTMPYGQSTITFDAGVYSANDVLELMEEENYWGSLEITMKAMKPQRT